MASARKIIRTSEAPEGLLYFPEFLSEVEEMELLHAFEDVSFYEFVMQGVAAKRRIHHFGFGYEFYSQQVHPAEPFPDWLVRLRDRAAPLVRVAPEKLEQALVARYEPGAGIGWHRDAPAFGPAIVGISLGTDEVMRFRKTLADVFEMYKMPLLRRSMYLINGPARSIWQHSLAPAKQLRYSITFRTVKDRYKAG